MRKVGTEEGAGKGSICINVSHNNQSDVSKENNCSWNCDKHPPTTHIKSPQYPADHGEEGDRRRWRDNSWSLHAIVGEVLHLDCLSDEQLGFPPLLVLDGLVDVHYLFTNVFVHFGQSLRNLCTVGCLLRHSVVETLWGRSECEQSDYIKLKSADLIFVWCLMNTIQWLKGCMKREKNFSVPDVFQPVSAYKRPTETRFLLTMLNC